MGELRNIPDIFNQAQFMADRHLASGRANKIAIYYLDKKITYAELVAMVNRTGNALKDLGVEMENRVILALPDCPELLYCYLGAMKIGAVPVPVNTLSSAADYLYFLNDSRAKVLVISTDLLPKIDAIKKQARYLKYIVVIGQALPGTLSYDKLVNTASENLEASETSKDDMAFWMYTSGTTGTPKGVVHLHHDLPHYLLPYCEQILKTEENDIVFCTSKVFFSYGRNGSLEIPLVSGISVVLYPDWPHPPKVFQVIEKYQPTLFFSVPSLYAALLEEAEKTKRRYDLSSIRLCISAGEALPLGTYDRWKAKFGLEIVEALGSTDVGNMYLSNQIGQVKPGSSGKLLAGFAGKLIDAEGNQVSQGAVGTLWLKNDGIASFYWHSHQRSKEALQGEWFNTGDRFYQDADGYFWFQGREDDMLKTSGQWVSPIEVERALVEHPAVRESGVVGVPDESGLTRVKAFVVLKAGWQASSELEAELVGFVRDRIAHFKAPRLIQFVGELPRTTTGKIQRHKLRQGLP